jgi:hypothetical protein
MSIKRFVAGIILLAGSIFGFPVQGQVAPTVTISGPPLGIGGGLSDYYLDYGQGRRMLGLSGWADYEIFHGLGMEVEATGILFDKPSTLQRMKQESYKGGAIYRARAFYGFRPYGKALIGIGNIDFPSNDPLYTHDTYVVTAFGGGLERRVWNTVFVRGDYEYQMWHNYMGPYNLTPNGFTIGATYYFRKVHTHK